MVQSKQSQKIQAPPQKEIKRQLITVFLSEDDTIDYEYSEELSDIIVQNNFLIHGILGKIQSELLKVDEQQETEEATPTPENEQQDID